jgi:hypothetical protein
MRGLSEDRRHVGPSADVPGVRACGLLRFIAKPARAGAFSCYAASSDPVGGTRRGLALVLYRRDVYLERFHNSCSRFQHPSRWLFLVKIHLASWFRIQQLWNRCSSNQNSRGKRNQSNARRAVSAGAQLNSDQLYIDCLGAGVKPGDFEAADLASAEGLRRCGWCGRASLPAGLQQVGE